MRQTELARPFLTKWIWRRGRKGYDGSLTKRRSRLLEWSVWWKGKKIMRRHNLHFITCASIVLLAVALPAYAGPPPMEVTVIDASNRVAFVATTDRKGSFSSANLRPGQYVVRFRAKSAAVKGDQYMVIVDAGQKPLLSNAIDGARFAAGGVAVRMEVKNGSKIDGQVESTTALARDNVKVINGARYFLVKNQLGSNLGARWIEEKSFQQANVSSLSADRFRQMQERGSQGNMGGNEHGPGTR